MRISFKTLAASVCAAALATSAQSAELRLSHQWSTKDVRHAVAEIVADEEAAADVDLDAARLSESAFMEALQEQMAEDDVMVLVHGYLAGGFVGKEKCITSPEDVQGLQTRAAGKSFEQMLVGAGASIASMASSEIYSAMQTGGLDAANTSSSSFVSYRIFEQVACYSPASDVALWFLYQPLLMNKSTFEGLTDVQQEALLAAAAKAEAYYLEEAKEQDAASVEVFQDAGVEIAQMTAEDFAAWQDLAQETSYKAFVDSVPDGQELLDMALAVE